MKNALAIMEENDEGILWVKLLPVKAFPSQLLTETKAILIPIKWFKETRKVSPRDQDVVTDHSSLPQNNREDVISYAHTGVPNIGFEHGLAAGENLQLSTNCIQMVDLAPGFVGGERGDDVCVVCMERPADLRLLPCLHDKFCRQCIVETICSCVRPEAPCCPLCRGAFQTMALLARDK